MGTEGEDAQMRGGGVRGVRTAEPVWIRRCEWAATSVRGDGSELEE